MMIVEFILKIIMVLSKQKYLASKIGLNFELTYTLLWKNIIHN